jgi:hypothetical protein
MVIRIPRPSDVLDAAQTVAGLPSRTAGLVEDTVRLLSRMSTLADKAEALLARADRLLDDAERTVTAAGNATRLAEEVIGRADATAGTAQRLIDLYGPTAELAAPLARQFVEELTEQEVHAAIQLIDQLPAFTAHMENDIMPILATLDRVGPDVHELLEVTRDLRQAIIGMPGFAFFRRRGENRDDEEGR